MARERGADFVMDAGGAGTLVKSLKSVRMGGRIAIVGVLTDATAPPATLSAACRAIALHCIRPVIDRVMSWTDAPRAVEALAGGGHFGKIVLAFA